LPAIITKQVFSYFTNLLQVQSLNSGKLEIRHFLIIVASHQRLQVFFNLTDDVSKLVEAAVGNVFLL
jgi:hypothetical protein